MGIVEETLQAIEGSDSTAKAKAWLHINRLVKPLGSLGQLEEIGAKYAAITGKVFNEVHKKNIIVMCADNGICEEGVSAADQQITSIMTHSIPDMRTGVGVLARFANAELTVVDIGVKGEVHHPKVLQRKVMDGTHNMSKGPAMSREEVIRAMEVGIEVTEQLVQEGYDLLGTGEMGIGNTSTSVTVIAALLGIEVQELVGLGAGLTTEQYEHKCRVLAQVLEVNQPNPDDVIDVLSKVGGLDIAGMCGCFLGAAKNRTPIVMDGLISCAAALCAYVLKPEVRDYMFTSHKSEEKAVVAVFEALGLQPILDLNMRLGEGSGCPLAFHIIESALYMVNHMATFGEASIAEESVEKLVDIREEQIVG